MDAGPVGLHRPACADLHGRGVWVRAADGGATLKKADPDVVQAGPGLRRRRGAVHPEPGRPRLQGHLERRHLDDRATSDRTRQVTPVGRHVVGRRVGRPERPVRDDLGPGQTPVSDAAHRRVCAQALRSALGDELPGRAALEGSGGVVAGSSRRRRRAGSPERGSVTRRDEPCRRSLAEP